MSEVDSPKLTFTSGYSARDAAEAEQRGFFGTAEVQLPGGGRVPVCFYDPVRLAQDLEMTQKSGDVCVAEPGLIVIPDVTLKYMEEAVAELYKKGYFDAFIPLR